MASDQFACTDFILPRPAGYAQVRQSWPFYEMKVAPTANCDHCGMTHVTGGCPRIKAIDYYEDGTIKRVEYRE